MGQVWDDIVEMIKTPFVGDLDVWHLFLLVGAVLVAILLWTMLLSYAKEGISEIA